MSPLVLCLGNKLGLQLESLLEFQKEKALE